MNVSEIKWADLGAAWGFVAVAAVLGAYLLLLWWRKRVAETLGDHPLVQRMASQTSRGRQWVKLVMTVAAAALLVAALMRPQYGVKEGAVTNTGIDIAIAIDVSKSMKVRDVVPDRLGGAELEVNALLDRLHGGRVALVPFAGIPFIQTPLTSDYEVVRSYLRELTVSDMPVGGTAIGRALRLSLDALTDADTKEKGEGGDSGEVEQFAGSKYKAIILFTDGEDHDSEPLEVAKELNDKGIKVFTVGVGTRSGNAIPILTDDGSVVGYQKAEDGKTPLISELNEPLLREIAKTTGGEYFQYANRSIADELYRNIDKLEKREYEARFTKLGEDQFQIPLLPAILLLLFEVLLSDRRRAARKLRKKARRAKTALATAAVALIALSAPGCKPDSAVGKLLRTTNGHVDEGNEQLASNEPKGALAEYEKAKEQLPEHAALDYDVGTAQLAMGDYEAAVKSLERALDEGDPSLRGRILYNLGLANGLWGLKLEADPKTADDALVKWKAAAARFEQLVIAEPDNDDAKWNLEVSLLRVDPPCSKRNDGFEPNEGPEAAKAVELLPNQETDEKEADLDLVLCPSDHDWFAVMLEEGDRLTVTMKPEAEEGADEPPEGGPVALELVAPDGKQVLASSVESKDDPNTIALPDVPQKSLYYLHVMGRTEDEYKVGLKIRALPACRTLDDPLEDDDTPETGTLVSDGEHYDARLCPGDPDWYRVTLGPDESLFAFANATKPEPKGFAMRIVDSAGVERTVAAAHEDSRIAALLTPGPGEYRIGISGDEKTEAKYQIQIKVLPPCPEGNDPLEPNDTPEQARSLEELAKAAPQLPNIPGQPGMPGSSGMRGRPGMVPGTPGMVPGTPGMGTPGMVPGTPGMVPGTPGSVAPGMVPGTPGSVAPTRPGTPTTPLPLPGQPGGTPGVRSNIPGPGPQAAPPMAPPDGGEQAASSALLRICDGDVDFVKVALPAEQKKIATILFDHEKGDLDLALYDESGEKVLAEAKKASPTANGVALALPEAKEDKTYLLGVSGKPGVQNFYVLRLDTPPDNQGGGQDEQKDEKDEKDQDKKDQDKNQDQKDQQDQKQDQKDQQEKKAEQERDPMEDALRQLDRNPRNLEAEEALRRSPFRNVEPSKDW